MFLHAHKIKFIKNNKKFNYSANIDYEFEKDSNYILDKFLKNFFYIFF